MPRNVADELGDSLQRFGSQIAPFMQAHQAAMAKAQSDDFTRLLKVADYEYRRNRDRRADYNADRSYALAAENASNAQSDRDRRYDLDVRREDRLQAGGETIGATAIGAKAISELRKIRDSEMNRRGNYKPKQRMVTGPDGLPVMQEIGGEKVALWEDIPYEEVFKDSDLGERFRTELLPQLTAGKTPAVVDSVMQYVDQNFFKTSKRPASRANVAMARQTMLSSSPQSAMADATDMISGDGEIPFMDTTPEHKTEWALDELSRTISDYDDLVAAVQEVKDGKPTAKAEAAYKKLEMLVMGLIQERLDKER